MAIPAKRDWTLQIFGANAAKQGGVVRRSMADLKKFGSPAFLKKEAIKRGFHIIRTGDQVVVFCNRGDLRIIC